MTTVKGHVMVFCFFHIIFKTSVSDQHLCPWWPCGSASYSSASNQPVHILCSQIQIESLWPRVCYVKHVIYHIFLHSLFSEYKPLFAFILLPGICCWKCSSRSYSQRTAAYPLSQYLRLIRIRSNFDPYFTVLFCVFSTSACCCKAALLYNG